MDWIQAAFVRLAEHGIQDVRVELLARDLGVSKGSFYWHFRDRADLLEKLLDVWQGSELSWIEERGNASAASSWAKLIERLSDARRIRLEVAMRAWAKTDEKASARVVTIERSRAGLIAGILQDTGFSRSASRTWSEVAMLACLGWMDRAARDAHSGLENRGLGELLSDVILAASARTAASIG
jgi:AcrR family transcriptional regulator